MLLKHVFFWECLCIILLLYNIRFIEGHSIFFVFDVDETLLHCFSNNKNGKFCTANEEALEFLDWARHSDFKAIQPIFIAWTKGKHTRIKFSLTELNPNESDDFQLSDYFVEENDDSDEFIIDREKNIQFGLYTNGIKDLDKLRIYLNSQHSVKVENNTIVLFDNLHPRLYRYNVCYMQYYLKNSLPIIVKDYYGLSTSPVRYHTYHMSYGESENHVTDNLYLSSSTHYPAESNRRQKWKFHDIRGILTNVLETQKHQPTTGTALLSAFSSKDTSSCAYYTLQPAKLYTVLVINLSVLNNESNKNVIFLFETFIDKLSHIQSELVGNTIKSLLFDCSPELHARRLCIKLKRVLHFKMKLFKKIQTDFNLNWMSFISSMDVVFPFKQNNISRASQETINVVEFGIASGLPQKTTLIIHYRMEMPTNLLDTYPLGNASICYANKLGDIYQSLKTNFLKEHPFVLENHLRGSHEDTDVSSFKKSFLAKKEEVFFIPQKTIQPDKLALRNVLTNDTDNNNNNKIYHSPIKQHVFNVNHPRLKNAKKDLLHTTTTNSEQESHKMIQKLYNPLLTDEFLLELIQLFGFLKQVHFDAGMIELVNRDTVRNAMHYLEESFPKSIACYTLRSP